MKTGVEEKRKKRRSYTRWIVGVFTLLLLGFTFVVWRAERIGGFCYEQSKSQDATSESYRCRLIDAANLPNVYLCLIGIGGILAAVGSLEIISRQARSMRFQTTLLRKSVDAQIASERAWLVAELVPSAMIVRGQRLVPTIGYTGELSDDEMSGRYFEYTLKIKNVGKTPAFVTKYTINRTNATEDGELIHFDLPYRYLEAGGYWTLYVLDIPKEVANYSLSDKVFFFGHVFYQHVFSQTETVSDHFACLFERETGRLVRMPMPEEKPHKNT